jgi:flagellin-like hook-associated protein FlgL
MVNINTNTGALMAARSAQLVQRNVDNASLRLASGLRVNSSADDAAGLAVSNKIVSQLRGMGSALKNTSDGISLIQTAIAGMQTSLEITQRLRELALQSHNGVYVSGDRNNIQSEADELIGELNRIATHTKFNGINLLDGSYSQDMRVGNTNPEIVNVTIDGMGINKHIEGESYAYGNSTQILSPVENATGTSDFALPTVSSAIGNMSPVYLATATASGTSSANLPSTSNAVTLSSNPDYLATDIASGTSSFDILAQSNATPTSNVENYKAVTNAEIRTASLSATSTFTTTGFNNGDFSDGTATQNGNVVSIPGWDIHLENAFLDGRSFDIGGHQAPTDNSYPPNFTSEVNHLTGNFQNTPLNNFVQNGSLVLAQGGGSTSPGYHVARGPYVVSQDAITLEVGDSVSFDWYGMAGGDAYDVYGYLLNEDTGATINLLNQTSTTSSTSTEQEGLGAAGWISNSNTVNIAGDYKFVFIAGTFDRTGGLYSGNGLRLRNIDVQQANPPAANELTARVTVQAVESDEVRIAGNLLTSAQTSASTDPGGTYTLLSDGSDFSQFTINAATGEITSVGPLRYDTQQNYEFTVRYSGPGGVQHDETVTLRLTPHDEASSVLTAQEGQQVVIDASDLPSFESFIDFETARGGGQVLTYSLSSYSDTDLNPANDGDPNDFRLFQIDSLTGQITSNGALDFTNKEEYHFNVLATAADGRTFVNHVILNLTDTINSTANFSIEETDQIVLNITDLTSSSDFALRNPGGTYSIGPGLNGSAFSIVGGQIIANNTFRIPNQSNYSFDLIYTSGANQHTERVNIGLTRYLQSDTVLEADESNSVLLSRSTFTELDAFAASDGHAGSYRLERYDNNDGNPANDGDADDFNQFALNSDGSVYSKTALDFFVEETFHFNLVYTATDGRQFTDHVILNLNDTLLSTASMSVEEADQIVINIADLTASDLYATRNPGGSFSIGAGSDLFSVVGNQVIANKEFRREEQTTYNFELIYTHSGIQHIETVQVDLSRFMQSQGNFVADEAQTVLLSSGQFEHMFNFTNDNPNGVYRLTGADAGFFEINSSGDVISKAPIDYDTRQMYDLDLTFTTDDGRVFTSQIDLEIRDTFAGKSTLQVEEAQSVIVDGALMTSLQTYAAKDGNQGQFELLPQGNHDLFTMASDGTLTSKGELRMADYPVINLAVRYNGVGMADFIEQISITLTPTSYDHSRSQFIAKESGEVVIIPQLNPYLQAYAEADNFAGRFEIVQSPFAVEIDQAFFEIDSTGQLRTTQMIDFESGKTDFEVTVLYHHSSNTKRYTDYLNLNIINDTRDDNNLALEGLDLSTREGAADAAKLLNEVVVRIAASQAKLGAIENRFTHNLDNLSMNILLAEQANGRIIDADYAIESTRLARSQILDQAATNMLVGANQAKQNLLMLLN